jgi:hypothetical protein
MMAPNVKSAATARARGRRYLRDLATEEHVVSAAILVPPEHLNKLRAGQRLQVKFTHLGPWYREWTWLRAISRTIREVTPEVYEIAVELTTDNPAGAAACPNPTPGGSYWPLGGSNPAKTAFPSDGVVYYLRPGLFYPITPTPGHVGTWHFAVFSLGGEGLTDYAGSRTQNRLRFIVVGGGIMTIQTQQFESAYRPLIVRVFHAGVAASGGTQVGGIAVDAVYLADAGDEIVVPVSTHDGTVCTHWVDVMDTGTEAGGKWGWSRMIWEPG